MTGNAPSPTPSSTDAEAGSKPASTTVEAQSATPPPAVWRQLVSFRGSTSRAVDLYVGIASFGALLALWVAATGFEWVQPQFLASPLGVVVRLYDLFAGVNVDHSFIWDIAISLYRVGVAFALSALMAIPLGILMSCYRIVTASASRSSISSAICRCRRWCRSR